MNIQLGVDLIKSIISKDGLSEIEREFANETMQVLSNSFVELQKLKAVE